MAEELTLDILDRAINRVKEMCPDPVFREIRINPDDWHKAKARLNGLLSAMGCETKVSEDTCMGIPVRASEEVPPNTLILYYDPKHFVVVENVL
jgi:hypothetical protein